MYATMSLFSWVITEERKKLLKEAKKLPDSHGNVSQVLEEALREYLKHHGSGNPNYALEKFDEASFRPYPSAWSLQDTTCEKLCDYSLEDLKDMKEKAESFFHRTKRVLSQKEANRKTNP